MLSLTGCPWQNLLGPSFKICGENIKSFHKLPMGKILDQLCKEGALNPRVRRRLKTPSLGDTNGHIRTADMQAKCFRVA